MALDIRDEETTLYKAGIRHGKAEGKAEGKAQGRAEVAAKLLRRGMGCRGDWLESGNRHEDEGKVNSDPNLHKDLPQSGGLCFLGQVWPAQNILF